MPLVIRIYDKFKEQAGKGKLTAANTRVELELHTDKAKQLIDDWLDKGNLVGFTFNFLNTYLLFVGEQIDETKLKGKNDRKRYYETLRPIPEWSLFNALGGSMKFINDPKKINFYSVMNWLEKYVASSLKLIQQTGKWNDLLETIVETELSPEQEALVKVFNTK